MINKIKQRFKILIHVVKSVVKRNKIILSSHGLKIKEGKVNLHWWAMNKNGYNVGDYLSYIVVEWMKNRNGITDDTSKSGKTVHLYGIGSIIGAGFQNATIWGSGIIRDNGKKFWWRVFRKLDIRCVRGPLTRKKLLDNGYECPEIYGDPGLLMPLIYNPEKPEDKEDYLIVAHYSHSLEYNNVISTIADDYKKFVDAIVSSKKVISTSLHGVILAEAYGIPAIWVRTNNVDMFKVDDYYAGTGRSDIVYANSVEEALSMTPPQIPDFTKIQNELINAFPVDLWK